MESWREETHLGVAQQGIHQEENDNELAVIEKDSLIRSPARETSLHDQIHELLSSLVGKRNEGSTSTAKRPIEESILSFRPLEWMNLQNLVLLRNECIEQNGQREKEKGKKTYRDMHTHK